MNSTRTSANLRKTVSPLEQLAWAEMSDEEFVERLAAEVWRRPAYYPPDDGGRVGVSLSKTRRFMTAFGKHFSTKERQQITSLVFMRAQELFNRACMGWAIKALELIGMGGSALTEGEIKKRVSLVAPRGAIQPTFDLIRAKLGEE